MNRYLCIHGHFYQPARENPWSGEVEQEPEATPYPDWNTRIAHECYEANSQAKILDHEGHVRKTVNTYSKISFNIGPTLCSWLGHHAPQILAAIVAADQESQEKFSGHGNAIAQAYHHTILPLANARDKRTQIVWGIREFEHRFGRKPEGLWLPETAVDLESLDIAARLGIRFTILAPHQAKRVHPIGSDTCHEVPQGSINPRYPYDLLLPSGYHIGIFFYQAAIATEIAFGHLLDDGNRLVARLAHAFSANTACSELVHIATDGETYGHHHRFGEMALAYALDQIESKNLVTLTNYGEYLSRHPPQARVEIHENTSWSCAHGIERWKSNCGCNSGHHPNGNQSWRQPLREALDGFRDKLALLYEHAAAIVLHDPWAARNDYIDLLLHRTQAASERFLEKHARTLPTPETRARLLDLLELERCAMAMYTSCGWFFDDISERGTRIVLGNAARAFDLATHLFPKENLSDFLNRLEPITSNVNPNLNARLIMESQRPGNRGD